MKSSKAWRAFVTVGMAITLQMQSQLGFAEVAVFSHQNNVLTLPAIAIDGQYYRGINVAIPPGQAWRLLGAGSIASPLIAGPDAAHYDSRSGTLRLPRTQIEGYLYADITLSVPAMSPWSLLSMGGMVSATTNLFGNVEFPVRSTISNRYATDSGGELTFQLDNGQVWKIVQDEPCLPGAAALDPAGTSEVEIYVNPAASGNSLNQGNFRFVSFYPDKREATAVESCIVVPVAGVGNYNPGPGPSEMQVSPVDVIGGVGERRSIFISGGSQPYTIVSSNPGVVSFYPQPVSIYSSGQWVDVVLDRVGQTTLTVLDYNRSQVTVNAQVNIAASTMNAFPSELKVSAGSSAVYVRIEGGTPPYRLYHNPSPSSLSVNQQQAGGYGQAGVFELIADRAAGNMNFGVEFVDARGGRLIVPVEITAVEQRPRDPILK